jgi:hypothetical protein
MMSEVAAAIRAAGAEVKTPYTFTERVLMFLDHEVV